MNINAEASVMVDLNNSSASLIASGNYEKAITSLRRALIMSKQLALHSMDQHELSRMTLDECIERSKVFNEYEGETNDTNEYLYQHAICIPHHFSCNHGFTVLSSTVIIFNLALAYQLLSAESASSDKFLRKSAQLYELAHTLLVEENLAPTGILLLMACINNLGLVFQKLNEMDKSRQCFQRLLSILMYLVERGQTDVSTFDGFFKSTYHLIARQITAPAA